MGISVSHFRGGRARWTGIDRMLALALTTYEQGVCGGCGQPLAETTDPLSDGNNPRHVRRYTASTPIVCHGCLALDIGRENVKDVPHPTAVRLPLTVIHRTPRP